METKNYEIVPNPGEKYTLNDKLELYKDQIEEAFYPSMLLNSQVAKCAKKAIDFTSGTVNRLYTDSKNLVNAGVK